MSREKGKGTFKPNIIDRVAFCILGLLLVANGLYLSGPWYLDSVEGERAPLMNALSSQYAVVTYGVLLLIAGTALCYVSFRAPSRTNTRILRNALLYGFLLRLYSLIGVLLTSESWRPPSYLSHAATVALMGAYWVWVKVDERPI